MMWWTERQLKKVTDWVWKKRKHVDVAAAVERLYKIIASNIRTLLLLYVIFLTVLLALSSKGVIE